MKSLCLVYLLVLYSPVSVSGWIGTHYFHVYTTTESYLRYTSYATDSNGSPTATSVSTFTLLSPQTAVVTERLIPTVTPIPAGLTTVITAPTSARPYQYTGVAIQLPSSAGYGSPSTRAFGLNSPDYNFELLFTYSSCSTTNSASRTISQPAVTAAWPTVIPTEMIEVLKPLSTTQTVTKGTTRITWVLNPTDFSPVEVARASASNQPDNCAVATAAVDYRETCSIALATATAMPTAGLKHLSCGTLNPCCMDCQFYRAVCLLGKCESDKLVDLYRCADGRSYFLDGRVVPTTEEKAGNKATRGVDVSTWLIWMVAICLGGIAVSF